VALVVSIGAVIRLLEPIPVPPLAVTGALALSCHVEDDVYELRELEVAIGTGVETRAGTSGAGERSHTALWVVGRVGRR